VADNYSGAFIGTWIDGVYYVTCVADAKYPEDRKIAGGMGEKVPDKDKGTVPETAEQCMVREVNHETGVQVLEAMLVYEESRGNHTRYFFLATKVSGLMTPGMTRKFLEKKAGDVVEEEVTAYMIPLEEFARRLFRDQLPAFKKILEQLATDVKFFRKYENLISKYTEQ